MMGIELNILFSNWSKQIISEEKLCTNFFIDVLELKRTADQYKANVLLFSRLNKLYSDYYKTLHQLRGLSSDIFKLLILESFQYKSNLLIDCHSIY